MNRARHKKEDIRLSAVIPVTERYDDLRELLLDYKRGILAAGLTYEFVVVLDGYYPQLLDELKKLRLKVNQSRSSRSPSGSEKRPH